MHQKKDILGIAFEPWETELVMSVNSHIVNVINECNAAVFIADTYQRIERRAKSKLNRLKVEYNSKVFDSNDGLQEWQNEYNPEIDYESDLRKWFQKNKISVSSRVLEKSDHIFSCFERSPYYKPMTDRQKAAILYFYIQKVEQCLDEFKPAIVWTIERNYLAKNIFYALCKSRSIPMFTLVHSRLKNKWFFSQEFVAYTEHGKTREDLSCNVSTYAHPGFHLNNKISTDASLYIQDWRERFRDGATTLYYGATQIQTEFIIKEKKNKFLHIIIHSKNTFLALLRLWRSEFFYVSNFRKKAFYKHVCWRVSLYYINQLYRKYLHVTYGYPFKIKTVPTVPFFYYPLHYRPESSTLTLGRGLNDELAIANILPFLPHGTVLAVKENPLMIEDRPRSFYRDFLNDSRIVLVDPLVSSQQMILECLGVLSVSGTALLEAKLIGKPAHAIGEPEFFRCLDSQGIDMIESFLVGCLNNSLGTSSFKAERYVHSIFSNGCSLDLGWDVLKEDNLRKATHVIADMLMEKFNNLEVSLRDE